MDVQKLKELLSYLDHWVDATQKWHKFVESEYDKRLAIWEKERAYVHSQIVESMRRVLLFDRHGQLDYKSPAGKKRIQVFVKDILPRQLHFILIRAQKHFGYTANFDKVQGLFQSGTMHDHVKKLMYSKLKEVHSREKVTV